MNEEKINKTKKETIEMIVALTESVFSEINSVASGIETKKRELFDVTVKYTELNKKIESLEDSLRERENKLKEKESIIEQELAKIRQISEKTEYDRMNANEEINEKVAQRDLIMKEIDSLKKEKESISFLSDAKKILEDEIEILKLQIVKTRSNIESDEKEASEHLKKIIVEIEEKRKELSGIDSEIEKKKKETLPKIQDIEKREAELKKKEESMATVIKRYERLYADKGVSFKI